MYLRYKQFPPELHKSGGTLEEIFFTRIKMIDIKSITDEQKDRIVNLEENHFYDMKSTGIAPRKLTKTIAAFANADGGDIYIGIEEIKNDEHVVVSRNWKGFDTVEAANGHIQIFTELFPLNSHFYYEFLSANDEWGYVLHINVNKNNEIIKASDSKAYVRKSAQNIPVDSTEGLRRLEFDKGITTFEKQTINLPLDIVTESEVSIKFIQNVIPNSTPIEWQKKQLLILNNNPTVASILLFSDIPQAALPKQSGIKIYRYSSKDSEGKREKLVFDPITNEGDIYSQIYESIKVTKQLVENIKILTENGLENVSYPTEAVHEIITNAVLHRDYSIQKDIHIRIFDNRIEIESPGRLPGHITTSNILREQFARNGSLVRIINKFPNPPNKDVGEGLNTAFESLKKIKLKPPVIQEIDNSVLVTIKHEHLASPEEIVMNYITIHKEITNRVGRDLTGIDSENEMKRVFQRLQAKELIYLDPNFKGAASKWILGQEKKIIENVDGDQLTLF